MYGFYHAPSEHPRLEDTDKSTLCLSRVAPAVASALGEKRETPANHCKERLNRGLSRATFLRGIQLLLRAQAKHPASPPTSPACEDTATRKLFQADCIAHAIFPPLRPPGAYPPRSA